MKEKSEVAPLQPRRNEMTKFTVYEIYEDGNYQGYLLESELDKAKAFAKIVEERQGTKVELVKAERYSEI